jgi:Lrp/AsnC family leucine-responsive transcriptional regulator
MIDDIDRQILEILQRNARTSNAEIARQVGMAPSAVLERVRKLEERGVIEGYVARVRPDAYGLGLTAYVFVRADERGGAMTTAHRIAEIDAVQEVHHVAGEDCFLVKVRTTGTRALGELLRTEFAAIDTIRSTRSTIVLDTVKDTWVMPVPARGEGDE